MCWGGDLVLHFHLSRSKISGSDENDHDTGTGMKPLPRDIEA